MPKKKSSDAPEAASRIDDGRARAYHEPVLSAQVISYLQPGPGKRFFDGTFGGGGHTGAFLEKGATVLACDQDPDAIREATRLLSRFAGRLTIFQGNFSDGGVYFTETGQARFDGILLDLGVSSHQLETPERGFSFQQEGPLDMRMNPDAGRSAADLVNQAPEADLVKIFFEYGEEPAARRIASRIVTERSRRAFATTRELAESVAAVVPKRGPRHPATKVFQALRIAVNDELASLTKGLRELSGWLKENGRMGVITFHSLEDRIVKQFFKQVTQEWIDRPEWPEPRRNPAFGFRLLTARPVSPGEEEQHRNPRARSAKLRVIERISL